VIVKIGIAVLMATVAFGASAASAQPWYGYGYGYGYGNPYGERPYRERPYYAAVPRNRVFSIVRAVGLRPVSEAMRAGPNFIVDAVDSTGRLKRVTINAYYGQVVRIAAVSRPDYPPRRGSAIDRPGGLPDDVGPDEDAPAPRRAERPPAPPPQARLPDDDEAPPVPPARIGRGAKDTPVGRDIPPPPAPLNNMHRTAKPTPPKHENKAAHGEDAGPASSKPHEGGDRSASVNPHPGSKPTTRHTPTDKKSPGKPAASPNAQAAAPRVVLPGGPAPKAAPAGAAAHTPRARATDTPAPASNPAPGSANIPPVQSLD
jgi:hypothetical protein